MSNSKGIRHQQDTEESLLFLIEFLRGWYGVAFGAFKCGEHGVCNTFVVFFSLFSIVSLRLDIFLSKQRFLFDQSVHSFAPFLFVFDLFVLPDC